MILGFPADPDELRDLEKMLPATSPMPPWIKTWAGKPEKCSQCYMAIMLGPRSEAALAAGLGPPICIYCVATNPMPLIRHLGGE